MTILLDALALAPSSLFSSTLLFLPSMLLVVVLMLFVVVPSIPFVVVVIPFVYVTTEPILPIPLLGMPSTPCSSCVLERTCGMGCDIIIFATYADRADRNSTACRGAPFVNGAIAIVGAVRELTRRVFLCWLTA